VASKAQIKAVIEGVKSGDGSKYLDGLSPP
jgi:hypothetical protein